MIFTGELLKNAVAFTTFAGILAAFTSAPQALAASATDTPPPDSDISKLALLKESPRFAKDKEIVLKGKGTIRDADALSEGVLFQIEYEHVSRAGCAVSTTIRQTDSAGKELVIEKTEYDAQGSLKTYRMQQLQNNSASAVKISQSRVFMTWLEDGKTSTSSDNATANTVSAGSLMAYLNRFANNLEQGLTVPVRLAIPDRGRVLGFDISRREPSCLGGESDFCVNLSLSNFFLRKVVRPITMSFYKSPEGFRPLSLEAPSLVRKLKNSRLEKFTARIDYQRL